MAETQIQVGRSLIKKLGASDNKTRSRYLREILSTWLPSQSNLSDDDMKKLWKGLFYCFWHSDKLPAQSYLIDRLTSLLSDLDSPLSAHYFSVFLLTMRREWAGIDFLRLDKFYLLIRRFFRSLFLLLKNNCWDMELCNRFMGIVLERTFLADDKFQGNGVNYHIASVFLEELKPFLPVSKQVVHALIMPLISVMGKVVDRVLLGKLKGFVFDELLKSGRALLELKKLQADGDDFENNDVVFLGTIALVMRFSAAFYEVGSSADCPQGNRKILLGLHEEFLKLDKALALSGIQVSLPQVNNGSSDDDYDGNEEKKKKNKKRKKLENGEHDGEILSGVVQTGENSSNEKMSEVSDDVMSFDNDVMTNLQMQFEKVAAEAGSPLEISEVKSNGHLSKKRKRSKGKGLKQSEELGDETGKSGDKSAQKSFIELCSQDMQKSMRMAILSIRELAKSLQLALRTRQKDAVKKICSWHYVNCIDLWVEFISVNTHDYKLQPLFYTMIQIINGVAVLFPGPRYLPLRVKTVQWLNLLSSSCSTFIPVASLALDILEYKIDEKHPNSGKNFDLSSEVKLPKHWMKSRNFQEACVFSTLELLAVHFVHWGCHISFPELATIPLTHLRKFHDRTSIESFRRMVKRFIHQVEQNVEFVRKKRDEVAFLPKDEQAVASFLQLEKSGGNLPFIQYYKSLTERGSSRDLLARS
ncbi:Protein REBELOTE [Linum perenne]